MLCQGEFLWRKGSTFPCRHSRAGRLVGSDVRRARALLAREVFGGDAEFGRAFCEGRAAGAQMEVTCFRVGEQRVRAENIAVRCGDRRGRVAEEQGGLARCAVEGQVIAPYVMLLRTLRWWLWATELLSPEVSMPAPSRLPTVEICPMTVKPSITR